MEATTSSSNELEKSAKKDLEDMAVDRGWMGYNLQSPYILFRPCSNVDTQRLAQVWLGVFSLS